MKKAIVVLGVIVATLGGFAYWYYSDPGRLTTEPEFADLGRIASDNDLISDRDPAVILRFDSAFDYVGGQKFILYGIADTEQHFFVETNAEKELQSVYWIQFEAYLPDQDHAYDYDDSPLRLTLNDYEFFTDTTVVAFDPNKRRRAGTDGAMARSFLANHGYVFPNDFAYARMVYLTDASRRKELMIIFIDDLRRYERTATELKSGGAFESGWPEVEQAHLDRIKNTLSVLPKSGAGAR